MKVVITNTDSGDFERKVDIRIDPYDTWSLDHTLALIIFPALLQLKQTKQGVPGEFLTSVGNSADDNYCFDFIAEDSADVFDQDCNKWNDVLDKMIWSFSQLSIFENYDDKYFEGYFGVNRYDKHPRYYDANGNSCHDERIQEGLDLFGKHFRSLWD